MPGSATRLKEVLAAAAAEARHSLLALQAASLAFATLLSLVPLLAVAFSIAFIWYSRNTGHSFWVYWGPFMLTAAALVLGIPVYRAMRGKMAAPSEIGPYR